MVSPQPGLSAPPGPHRCLSLPTRLTGPAAAEAESCQVGDSTSILEEGQDVQVGAGAGRRPPPGEYEGYVPQQVVASFWPRSALTTSPAAGRSKSRPTWKTTWFGQKCRTLA